MLKINSIYILVWIIQRQGPTTGFCKEGDEHSDSIEFSLFMLLAPSTTTATLCLLLDQINKYC
jgi:hypothetical protein